MVKQEIIHKRTGALYWRGAGQVGWAYCLVCSLPKERTSRTWDKVTCKRCLRSKPKK